MTTPSRDPSGVVVLDKPEGLTSHDVVARLRRVLETRRVGHAGTLDPMATGVLVLAYGRGTRLLPYLQATTKEYLAGFRLGQATSTDDRTGEPLGDAVAVSLSEAEVDALLLRFTGQLQQRPSSVSAVKVAGRRAYERVRSGEQVQLQPRPVSVTRLRRRGPVRRNDAGGIDFDAEVVCSTGTYVRALARDIGAEIASGGHLTALRRTAVGPFDEEAASPLPEVGADLEGILPLARAAAAVLPVIGLDHAQAASAGLGQRLPVSGTAPAGPTALLGPDGGLVAVAQATDGRWHYLVVFGSP